MNNILTPELRAIAKSIAGAHPLTLADAAEQADYAHRMELRASEEADDSTRAARDAMRAIGWFSERVACSLIAFLINRISTSNFSHMDHARNAIDSLTDAHSILESAVEKHGG
jgi:hypothetical protein